MKKLFKKILVLILLFSLGISRVYAATPTFSLLSRRVSDLKNDGLITYDWHAGTNGTSLCANSTSFSCKKNSSSWWSLYSVKDGSKYYIVYCLNPSRAVTNNDPMTQYNDLNSARFSDSSLTQEEKNARLEMLKKLLLYGYNPDPTNSSSLTTLANNDPQSQLKLWAMQVLVWEVMEGGRTTFDTEEPQWNGTYSLYNQVIKPNGKDSTSTNTLYYYYQKFREDARVGDQANPSPAFNEDTYTLAWDSINRKYQVVVPGIGDYDSCTVDNSDVNLSVASGQITLSTTETVNSATVTCKYYRGTGASNQTQEESFKYFRFNNNTSTTQDMVYGSGWKIYSKSFNISTENTNLSIKKLDADSNTVSGSKFTLTHMTNQSYSVVVDGNGTTQDLTYSGKYRVSETTAPKGYEKINDFNITINAKTHKITNCDNERKDSNGNVISCLNNQVRVSYNGDEIELSVINVSKNYKILKVNSSNTPINGATFEIRDKNDNVLKFSMSSGNIYKYDTEGTITSLYNATLSSYPVALLPEGEYKVVETVAPNGYRLPINEEDRTTLIKINSNRDLLVYDSSRNTYAAASSSIIKVVNYATKFSVLKTGYGNALEGVQFELYNEDKTQRLNCLLESPGVYYYIDNQELADNYVYVTNSNGYITFKNLPAGTYYLKEIATISPYILPQGDGVYTKVEINVDENGVSINGNYSLDTINISNSINSFNFYKKDTAGNPLTTGKYKLQKYDKEAKKYVDLKLVEVENDGTYSSNTDVYKVDEENGKIQFTLTKGMATFIEMESSSTYRIIETVAPEGYTKASTKDTATVHIDQYGNASGLLVLIDQKIVKEDDSAFAELIINIQTGKERIMYSAVIILVIGIIAGLIIYNKRKK